MDSKERYYGCKINNMNFDNYDNNYEMKDWNEVKDRNEVTVEQEQEQEQETNFDEFEDVVVNV